jgi:hypothetical protein
MGRPGQPVLSWAQVVAGSEVRAYTGGVWKRGVVTQVYENSCLITFKDVPTPIRVYSTRSIRLG